MSIPQFTAHAMVGSFMDGYARAIEGAGEGFEEYWESLEKDREEWAYEWCRDDWQAAKLSSQKEIERDYFLISREGEHNIYQKEILRLEEELKKKVEQFEHDIQFKVDSTFGIITNNERIKELEEENEMLLEGLDFYGEESNWGSQDLDPESDAEMTFPKIFHPMDHELSGKYDDVIYFGGKRAREITRKIDESKKGTKCI